MVRPAERGHQAAALRGGPPLSWATKRRASRDRPTVAFRWRLELSAQSPPPGAPGKFKSRRQLLPQPTTGFEFANRGSDSNREKNNDLPGDSCSEMLLQTMVIEKPQDFRARPRDLPGSWSSITILECDFSNPALGDEFREGKTRWNWGLGPRSLVFSPLLSEPLP
jgi:hypothetical protein